MRQTDREIVRELKLFKDIDKEVFDSLMTAAYAQRIPPHVELIREGEPADFLHIVLDGCVELFSSGHGRESSLAIVSPVSTFILAATVNDAPFLMSARTIESSKLLLIPSQNVRNAFHNDPNFAQASSSR
mgnify:FL=1